ncbi:MAG: hypothetical protein PHX20_01405 [Candidatus Omnitrophica bacterium]|nr:hypothetical protein [Candidatus Omnitrophota bacterium]MDD5436178.1 hypothetical protein [Candidatus Omnitrophota bacterium]
MPKSRAFTVVEVLVVACAVLAMIVILAPFMRMAKDRANKIYCANNLRQISLGLHKFALDHNGVFPDNLGALYPDYVTSGTVFDCPGKKHSTVKSGPDYIYRAGLTESSASDEIIVQDSEANHAKSGKHIVRVDGSVEWAR